jgi:hypothetical protein
VLLLSQLGAVPCFAQLSGMGGGQPGGMHARGGSRNNSGTNQTTQAPPPLPRVPEPWPRLDPGAMLCRSEDALKQYQEAMEAGTGPAPLPADCTRVQQPMAISIVQRDGPSRAEVKSTSAPGTGGWTDAWLPDRPPPPRNAAR